MKTTVLLLLASLMLFGCEKTSGENDFNAFTYLDINNDAQDDLVIVFWGMGSTDVPQSSSYWQGEIQSLGSNSFLFSQEKASYLLNPGTVISHENTNWTDSTEVELLSVYCSLGTCDKSWSLLVDEEDSYYFGVKFATDSSFAIGWVKLLLDTKDGSITMQSSDYTFEADLTVPE